MRTSSVRQAVTVRDGDFAGLVAAIRQVNAECTAHALRAVNVGLTLRNWLIGAHIHHYELHGTDRAQYGAQLLIQLAARLAPERVSNAAWRRLTGTSSRIQPNPRIVGTLFAEFVLPLPARDGRFADVVPPVGAPAVCGDPARSTPSTATL